jgi:copper homeostasis protein
MIFLELCVDSVASALAARNGGASRLELCDALIDGGLTPSLGKIEAVVRAVAPLPVHVLVRPRAGDFCYDEIELGIMERDIEVAARAGAVGIVTGVLTAHGHVDEVSTRRLFVLARTYNLRCVFHRAVDTTIDFISAIVTIARLDADEILTTGGEACALNGALMIAAAREALIKEGLLETTRLIAGGGLTAENVSEIIYKSKVTAVHGTFREFIEGPMIFRRNPPIYMGSDRHLEPIVEYGRRESTQASVEKVCEAIKAKK